MEFLFEFSTVFIMGEHSERVTYWVEHQQLIGDFQTHVKPYLNINSPSQDSFHHQQFTNLLPRYIVGAGVFVKWGVVSVVLTQKRTSVVQVPLLKAFFPSCFTSFLLPSLKKTTLKSLIKFVSSLGILLSFCLLFSFFPSYLVGESKWKSSQSIWARKSAK